MQYILTQEEYDALIKRTVDVKEDAKNTINELCKEVAIHKPVRRSWATHLPPSPWGCIHQTDQKNSPIYCDECPVIRVCKLSKECSK